MSLGPPRQGKSTTLRRIKKEIIDLLSAKEEEQIHGSTGTVECCSNVVVQGKSDPTTAERSVDWTIVKNPTEEASLLFHTLKDSFVAESTSETESTSEATADSHGGSDTRAKVSQASSTGQSHQIKKQQIRNTNQSRPAQRSQHTKCWQN